MARSRSTGSMYLVLSFSCWASRGARNGAKGSDRRRCVCGVGGGGVRGAGEEVLNIGWRAGLERVSVELRQGAAALGPGCGCEVLPCVYYQYGQVLQPRGHFAVQSDVGPRPTGVPSTHEGRAHLGAEVLEHLVEHALIANTFFILEEDALSARQR